LEITETIAMGDADRSTVVLSELKALGVHLDIDDFGTGYSSLSRLQRFPVDTLKIDRSFVSRMDTDVETREIVRIIVMLAHGLRLKVVAEGVETEAQAEMLKDIGCELGKDTCIPNPSRPRLSSNFLATPQTLLPTHERKLLGLASHET
jgi:EAL domain-containing protein (putative c-di-GMP-specific phosphodiesterase class I)